MQRKGEKDGREKERLQRWDAKREKKERRGEVGGKRNRAEGYDPRTSFFVVVCCPV